MSTGGRRANRQSRPRTRSTPWPYVLAMVLGARALRALGLTRDYKPRRAAARRRQVVPRGEPVGCTLWDMTILHIEHPVLDYDRWKAMFDSDPVGRKKSGVRRYRIVRAADDPDLVMIDLEFDTMPEAEKMLAALQELWTRVDGVLIQGPKGRIFDVAEAQEA